MPLVPFAVPLVILFAVGLAADLLGAAFQPVSGVDFLLEQPSAVPLPFEQHQPLAVASFLLEQPEHQEFPPLAPLPLFVYLMLLMPVFVRQPEPAPFVDSPYSLWLAAVLLSLHSLLFLRR